MNVNSKTWDGWHPGEFQIHFIHTGVAESIFLVFPDSTTMLLDCGDQAAITRHFSVPVVPGPERLAGEWIARYVARTNPNGRSVDWLVVSHFHSDHAGTPRWQKYPRVESAFPGVSEPCGPVGGCARSGIGLAAEFLRFKRATDRGFPTYADPLALGGDGQEQPEIANHVRSVWQRLQSRDGLILEKFRLGASDQFVAERGPAPGFSVRNICANGRVAMPDGSVRDLYAPILEKETPAAFNENALSLGMVFTYGEFRFGTFGDFSDKPTMPDGSVINIEDTLAQAVGHVHVAKMNHHGHHTTSKAFFETLHPSVWVACVWDQLHCTDDSMQLLPLPGAPASRQPLVVPTFLPDHAEPKPLWHSLVPAACRVGCHVVISVPQGGRSFNLSLIDARDENMTVLDSRTFETL